MNEVNSKSNMKRIAIQRAGQREDDLKAVRDAYFWVDVSWPEDHGVRRIHRILDRLERYERYL